MRVSNHNYHDRLFKYMNNYLKSVYQNEFGLSITAKDIILDLPGKLYIKCLYSPPEQLTSYASYPLIETPRVTQVEVISDLPKDQINKLYSLLKTDMYKALTYIKDL